MNEEQDYYDEEDRWQDSVTAVLDELQAEIHNSPGMVAHRTWTHVRHLYYATEADGGELLTFLAHSQSGQPGWPPFALDGDGPAERAAWYRELSRLLNNYVSAADALADHAIPTMRAYPDDAPFKPEYERRADAVRGDRGVFVGRLRNAALHARQTLPYVTGFASTDMQHLQVTIGLSVRALLDDFGRYWSGPARRYIESHDELVDLVDTFDGHLSAVVDLYRWLFAQFHIIHEDDLLSVDRLVHEYNETIRGRGRAEALRPDPDDERS